MKKILILATIAIIGALGMNAQTPAPGDAPCPSQEQQCREGRHHHGRPALRQGQPQRFRCADPFANINLTEAQRTQLEQAREEMNARFAQCRQERCTQNCDSASCTRDRSNCTAANDSVRMAKRSECYRTYLAKVREILGPEAYVQFLENSYIDSQASPRVKFERRAGGERRFKGATAGRFDKKAKKDKKSKKSKKDKKDKKDKKQDK